MILGSGTKIPLALQHGRKIESSNDNRTCEHAALLQLCPSLSDPMDCSLPGSSVHGILQARILEWVAVPSSRGFFQLRDLTLVS